MEQYRVTYVYPGSIFKEDLEEKLNEAYAEGWALHSIQVMTSSTTNPPEEERYVETYIDYDQHFVVVFERRFGH